MKIYIDTKKNGNIYYMEKDAMMRVKIGHDNVVNFRDATEVDFTKLDKKAQKLYQKIRMQLLD